MPIILAICSFFGISPLRLIIYASIFVAVVIGALTIRQHYINVGWYKHEAKVAKQDGAAVAASNRVEEKTRICTEKNGFWDVVSQGCKLEDEN
jgi:hypothetical protein